MARLSAIEAMRGAAAISVALFHFSGRMESPLANLFHAYGWAGVDVFFFISGFVIPLSLYGKNYRLHDFPLFLVRRLVRLEPPYLMSIALVIALAYASTLAPQFAGQPPAFTPLEIASHLFYVVPLTNFSWVNPAYWSLAYEFVFYVTAGLTFSFLISADVGYCAALAALFLIGKHLLAAGWDVRILEFLAGALCMRLHVEEFHSWRTWAWSGGTVLVIFCLGGAVIGSAVLCAGTAALLFRSVERGRWAYALGGISYSLYLVHIPIGGRVVNLAMRYGSGPLYECGVLIAALALSVVCAAVMASVVEKPAIRWSHRITWRDRAEFISLQLQDRATKRSRARRSPQ